MGEQEQRNRDAVWIARIVREIEDGINLRRPTELAERILARLKEPITRRTTMIDWKQFLAVVNNAISMARLTGDNEGAINVIDAEVKQIEKEEACESGS